MSPRYDEFRSDRGIDPQLYVPADDVTPPLLRSHYFVSAYLRFFLSLVGFAATVAVLGRLITDEMWQYPPPMMGRAPLPDRSTSIDTFNRMFPWWHPDAGWVEGTRHVFEHLVTSLPVAAVVVVGAVVAAVLEWSVGR